MSYCRWSTDNFRCDIYTYESVYGGYEINVASSRYNEPIPEVDYSLLESGDNTKFANQYSAQSRHLETCGTKPIGLKYDGKSFSCDTVVELIDTMLMLREEGYRFPDYVIEDMKEEMT